jgi:hypothetical protein
MYKYIIFLINWIILNHVIVIKFSIALFLALSEKVIYLYKSQIKVI